MMRQANISEDTVDTSIGEECDWSTLLSLAGRAMRTANLAVMAHGEHDSLDQMPETVKEGQR